MLSTVIAILSGALVALGAMALVRDRAKRRRARSLERRVNLKSERIELAEVTIVAPESATRALPTATLTGLSRRDVSGHVGERDPMVVARVSLVPSAIDAGATAPQIDIDGTLLGHAALQTPKIYVSTAAMVGDTKTKEVVIDRLGATSTSRADEQGVAGGDVLPSRERRWTDGAGMTISDQSLTRSPDGLIASDLGPDPALDVALGQPARAPLPELPSASLATPRLAPEPALQDMAEFVPELLPELHQELLQGGQPAVRSALPQSVVPASAAVVPAPPAVAPAANVALSLAVPAVRTLDGLTIGQLPPMKPALPLGNGAGFTGGPQSNPGLNSQVLGGFTFAAIPPSAAPVDRATEARVAAFGTPLMTDLPRMGGSPRSTSNGARSSAGALDDLVHTIGTLTAKPAVEGIEQPRSQRVELDFFAILPNVLAAIDDVRAPLERVGIEIGPHGQPTWGARNQAYGTLQRLERAGDVVAWLICEMEQRGALSVRVVPELSDNAVINGSARRDRGPFERADIANIAAEALKPLATYAAVVLPKRAQDRALFAATQTAQWNGTEPIVREALLATNAAFLAVGAQIEPMGDAQFDPATERVRWPLSVEVGGAIVALMILEQREDWLDVTVQPSDSGRPELARRARTAAQGLGAQALAEVMAEAAWPAIVDARSGQAGS